ncbi:hypothetical protein DYY65_10090 [Nitrososphaera sp. AFS]|nr:hypothetical protein [Nitrososphaera sp. AFS]
MTMRTKNKKTQTDIRYWYKHGIYVTNISLNSFVKVFPITIGSSVFNSNYDAFLVSKGKLYINKPQYVLVIQEKSLAEDQALVRNDTIKRML